MVVVVVVVVVLLLLLCNQSITMLGRNHSPQPTVRTTASTRRLVATTFRDVTAKPTQKAQRRRTHY